MSGFCIFRSEKHNSVGAVSAALSHDLRARQTLNADPKLYEKNTYSSTNIEDVLLKMNQIVKSCDEVCKNDKPVLCIQYLITASPEAADDPKFSFDQYLHDGLDAIKKKHGAENVIFSAIHRDESTPHMTVYVVPVVDEPAKKVKRSVFTGKKDESGKAIRELREFDSKQKRKLSAAHFLDGSKKLSELQTWFHNEAGLKNGLQRGVLGSRSKHIPVSQYYEAINKTIEKIIVPSLKPQIVSTEKNILGLEKHTYENNEQLTNRVVEELNRQFTPSLKKINDANNLRKSNKGLSSTNKQLSDENENLRIVIKAQDKGLSISDTRAKELAVIAKCAELAEHQLMLEGQIIQKNAEIKNKDIEIQNKNVELNMINKKITDAKGMVIGFTNRCASLLHAVFQRDVRDVFDRISDLSECLKEILTDAPELEDALIKETKPIDDKLNKPLFESIIKQNSPRMR